MRYVALLRGINVTGNNMIKMTDLKAAFESLGFDNVVTYINSGNIAFDTKKTAEGTLLKKIETAIEKLIGKPISAMIRTQDEIKVALAVDPFKGKYESHKQMHLLFTRDTVTAEQEKLIVSFQNKDEKVIIRGRDIYALLLNHVAESDIGRGIIERKVKIPITARNWRTVEALTKL